MVYLIWVTSSPARHHVDLIGTRPSVHVGVGHSEGGQLSVTVQHIVTRHRRPYDHRWYGTQYRHANHWCAETPETKCRKKLDFFHLIFEYFTRYVVPVTETTAKPPGGPRKVHQILFWSPASSYLFYRTFSIAVSISTNISKSKILFVCGQ